MGKLGWRNIQQNHVFLGGGICVLVLLSVVLFYFAKKGTENSASSVFLVPKTISKEEMQLLEGVSIDNCTEKEMYEKYVGTVLGQPLYNSRDAYDAFHYLAVPLYYAFQSGDPEYMQMFHAHMAGFAALSENEKEEFQSFSIMDRLHYLYFASEYMCLCAENGISVPENLFTFVYQQTAEFAETYQGAWESKVKYQDIWELLEGLLTGEGYGNGKSYSNIITDIDLFVLTIFCDLKFVYEKEDLKTDAEKQLFSQAAEYVDLIFQSQVFWEKDGTWQLQPGAWRDHPDYLYAGISDPDKIQEGTDYRVEDCTWDAGHCMRFPVFLRSYLRVFQSREKKAYYEKLLDGFGVTFLKNVLVFPDETSDYYRMNNYMNGRNGLYRYGYHQESVGIGPYQNSICLLLGLYAFSGNAKISKAYCNMAEKFPLDEAGKEIYTDPTTIREQNAIFQSENYRQFLCYLAGRLEFSH